MTRRDLLPLGALLLALVAIFHRLLLGDVLFWGLPSLQFYPWRQYAFEQLAHGHLPAWNPYLGAGAPLLANYQTALFYPPNWLHLLLPDAFAMSVIALLHVAWAGVGMWLFVGALELPPLGRGISMLAYALGSYLIGRFGSFPTADAGAWIPWIFWLVHRVIIRQRAQDVGWLALAFGMQLLAGHAQTTWYSCVGVGLYALWLVIRNFHANRRGMVLAGIALLLGGAVAAIQLVPTAEYLQSSQRSDGLDYETLANLSYHPLRLITLLSPNFYGTPADGTYLTKNRGVFFEDAAYIGFLPLVSALAAVWGWLRLRRRQDAERGAAFETIPFWAGLAVLALILALGKHSPVFRLLYDYMPTFDAFREPVRWLVLTVFGLSVLAGIGIQHWGRGKWIVFWSRLSAAGGGAMALMALAYVTFSEPESDTLTVLSWGMIVLGCWIAVAALLTLIRPDEATGTRPGLWQGAVLAFVTVDLAWAGSGLNPSITPDYYDPAEIDRPAGRVYWFEDYRYDVTFGTGEDDDNPIEGYFDLGDYRRAGDQWHAVRTSLLPDMTMLDRVPSYTNNDPLLPDAYGQYVDLIEDLGTASAPLLRAANVSAVFGPQPDHWMAGEPLVVMESGQDIPAWLASEAQWPGSGAALRDALRDPAWNPAQTVFLIGRTSGAQSPDGAVSGSVTLLESSPDDVRYRVQTNQPTFLVISQTWYPGWSATLDGYPVELVRANLAFQAVGVPAGEHEVRLRYTPTHWTAGVTITILAVLVVGALVGWGALWRNRSSLS